MFKSTSANTTGQDLTLTLYLKHFRDSTISYILKTTGYKNITEYEVLCRSTDAFPIKITSNSVMLCDCPNVDPKLFCVFPLSLHHLYYSVLNRVMDHYIGMEQLDYEFMYGQYNTIYVVVPYKEKLAELFQSQYQMEEETEEDISDEETEPEVVYRSTKKTTTKTKVHPRVDDDDVPMVYKLDQLDGWKFHMNPSTKNSYILTPPGKVQSVKKGTVSWVGGTTPTTWTPPFEGIERPIYYNQTSVGWIVSLRLLDELLLSGAKLQK
jgi:hypothetical protein